MRLLYGINGTGNGHRSRAIELMPVLTRHAEVDVLVSGHRHSMPFPFEVRYWMKGVSFAYSDGGVDVWGTASSAAPIRLVRDIAGLDLSPYDAVVTDFEPVSAWAARLRGVPCVHLSHQASLLSDRTPRPSRRQRPAESFIRHFAPADEAFGLHFERYDTMVLPPVVRASIRSLNPTAGDAVAVYLPSVPLADQIETFRQHDARFAVFSPKADQAVDAAPHVRVEPASDRTFVDALASSRAVIAHTGFELPSEAMYLGKPLLAMPIMGQYEQLCNAAALQRMGVTVLAGWPEIEGALPGWLRDPAVVRLPEVIEPADLVTQVLRVLERASSGT